MPLVTTKKMFRQAYEGGFAIGAFNFINMEILQGIVEACREENAPLILQITKGGLKFGKVRYLKALVQAALEEVDLPIALHLDHGDTYDLCRQCVDDGFTSVMIDASHDPIKENRAKTKKVVEYAHKHKVVVEAEIGQLGGIEEDVVGVSADDVMSHLTDPAEAEQFIKETGCDSLAVACGTSHGAYKFKNEPKLAFDVIEEISKRLPGLPLVMHGSSGVPREYVDLINKYGGDMPHTMGVPDDTLRKAAQTAVCKINIDTDLRLAMTAKIRQVFGEKPGEFDLRNYLGPGREAVKETVRQKLHVLGCAGKADVCQYEHCC
jgi:fructose-bisphosphate aldolase class II